MTTRASAPSPQLSCQSGKSILKNDQFDFAMIVVDWSGYTPWVSFQSCSAGERRGVVWALLASLAPSLATESLTWSFLAPTRVM